MSKLDRTSTTKDIDALLREHGIRGGERTRWRTFLKAYLAHISGRHALSADLFAKLIKSSQQSWFISMVYQWIAVNHIIAGNASLAEEFVRKALQTGTEIRQLYPTMVQIYYIQESFEKIRALRERFANQTRPESRPFAEIMAQIILGNTKEAKHTLEQMRDFLQRQNSLFALANVLLMLGLAERTEGNISKAGQLFLEAGDILLSRNSYYAIFAFNKYEDMHIHGLVPRLQSSLRLKARRLCKNGPLSAKAGLMEQQALQDWREHGDDKALTRMIQAAQTMRAAGESLEAYWGYLRTAFMAYTNRRGIMLQTLDYILPRMSLYPFVEHDPVYGEFARTVLKAMATFEIPSSPGVVVKLFDRMEIQGMKKPESWRSKKALSLFKYLLLNRGVGLAKDYLAYLVWPKHDPKKAAKRLTQEISIIRKEMGEFSHLLSYRGGIYTLHENPDFYCDVNEFQSLIREAESLSQNPEAQLEKLRSGLLLYRGQLLPEDRYDRFIEEHRSHLHKVFQNALMKTVEILLEQDRAREAREVAQRFYLMFPKDEVVVRVFINVLTLRGEENEAQRVFDDFKKRLWREHRLRPSFKME